MNNENLINAEVEKTLNAFDELQDIDANPFLFTRIEASLASQPANPKTSLIQSLRLKPIGLALIILLNIITAIHFLSSSAGDNSKNALIYSLNREYNSTQSDF